MGNVRASQGYVLALVENPPTENVRASQGYVLAAVSSDQEMRVSQGYVLALVKSVVAELEVRAWTVSFDGHDFYILQLGRRGTLVCDLTTGQWSEWQSGGLDRWRAIYGRNWIGIGGDALNTHTALTNMIAGDYTNGVLWLIDPDLPYDENPTDESQVAIPRTTTGGVPIRMRQTIPCNEVYLQASLGETGISADGTVQLETSDDAGRTWTDQGTLTVVNGDWTQELAWRSLGLISAPGRIFRITDNCLARIDAAEFR